MPSKASEAVLSSQQDNVLVDCCSSDEDSLSGKFVLARTDIRKKSGQLWTLLTEYRDGVFCSSESRFPPMVLLLQHFEVLLPTAVIKEVSILVSKYFQEQKYNESIEDYLLSTSCLYGKLRKVIGHYAFDRVSRKLRDGECTMAVGLAPSATLRSQKCSKCKARRCLHTFCAECGHIFDVKVELCKEMSIRPTAAKVPQEQERSKKKHQSNKALNVQDSVIPTTESQNASRKKVDDFRKRCNQEGIAGIKELFRFSKDAKLFRSYGGDILFLLRNIAVTAIGDARQLATSCFQQVCTRWMEHMKALGINLPDMNEGDEEILIEKMNDAVIKDTVEGLYVITKILVIGSRDRKILVSKKWNSEFDCPKSEQIKSKNENQLSDIAAKKSKNSPKKSDVNNILNKKMGADLDAGNEESDDDSIEFVGVKKSGDAAIVMQCKAKDGNNDNENVADHGQNKNLKKRKLSCGPVDKSLNSEKSNSNDALKAVPNSTKNDEEKDKDKEKDKEKEIDSSKSIVNPNTEIDTSELPLGFEGDAMIIKECLSSRLDNYHSHVVDFTPAKINAKKTCKALMLPVTRSVHCSKCGPTDYGQHTLNRQIFAEEFRFIVLNLDYVGTELKDMEVLGEFVHCLKILQYTEEADPELELLVTSALQTLLNRRRAAKAQSASSSSSSASQVESLEDDVLCQLEKKYKAYHTSYCAAIGLLNYEYLQNDETRLHPPVSGIFKFCDTYVH